MATSSVAPFSEECMRVVVRLKPPSDVEQENEFSQCVVADTQNSRISIARNRKGNSEYSFYGTGNLICIHCSRHLISYV